MVEHLVWDQGVAGSNPVFPIFLISDIAKMRDRRISHFLGSLSKRTDAKILIIIFKLLDGSLIVFLF